MLNVTTKHVSSNLRLTNNQGDEVRHIRTLMDVRPTLDANAVASVLGGVNVLLVRPATNALLTTRTEIAQEL